MIINPYFLICRFERIDATQRPEEVDSLRADEDKGGTKTQINLEEFKQGNFSTKVILE